MDLGLLDYRITTSCGKEESHSFFGVFRKYPKRFQ